MFHLRVRNSLFHIQVKHFAQTQAATFSRDRSSPSEHVNAKDYKYYFLFISSFAFILVKIKPNTNENLSYSPTERHRYSYFPPCMRNMTIA